MRLKQPYDRNNKNYELYFHQIEPYSQTVREDSSLLIVVESQ